MERLVDGRFSLELNREEHLFTVDCLRFAMWQWEPAEFSAVVGWPPSEAYSCLTYLLNLEESARSAGHDWVVHPRAAYGRLSLSGEGDPQIRASIHDRGSTWTLTWPSIGVIRTCMDRTLNSGRAYWFAPTTMSRGNEIHDEMFEMLKAARRAASANE
jgi:hypothetical protein